MCFTNSLVILTTALPPPSPIFHLRPILGINSARPEITGHMRENEIICDWVFCLSVRKLIGLSIFSKNSEDLYQRSCRARNSTFTSRRKYDIPIWISYSWVENNSSLSRTHVARSTEPYLARFFYIDL